jgi:hypothetical protein
MSAEVREFPRTHPTTVFFRCYRCSEWTMSVTPFGVYCQGCGLQAFAGSGEARVDGECASGHSELVESHYGVRCLVCSTMGGPN